MAVHGVTMPAALNQAASESGAVIGRSAAAASAQQPVGAVVSTAPNVTAPVTGQKPATSNDTGAAIGGNASTAEDTGPMIGCGHCPYSSRSQAKIDNHRQFHRLVGD